MMQPPKKLAKDKFRCFKCRLIFSQRDGDWVAWDSMQVHLCNGCDRLTKGSAERGHDVGKG